MVTYKDTTQVVRNNWGNQQAKTIDSGAILLIIGVKINFGLGFINFDDQTNKHKLFLTNQIN